MIKQISPLLALLLVGTLWTTQGISKTLASSWDSTDVVNTESFNIIDDQDGVSDVYLQFGDSLGKQLRFERTAGRFNFSDDLHVDNNISGSGSLKVENTISQDGDTLTINADSTNADATLVFGNDLGNEILAFNNTKNLFTLSDDLTVQGSVSGSNLQVSGTITGATLQLTNLKDCASISTDANGNFACAASVDGSGSALALYQDTAGGQDANGAGLAITWTNEVREDTGFTHDTIVNNSRIQLDENSWYQVSYSISHQSSGGRRNVHCRARMNGVTPIEYSNSYTYSRNATDKWGTNHAMFIVEAPTDNEYIEIICDGVGSAGAATTISNESWIVVERLGSDSGLAPYCSNVTGAYFEPATTGTLVINGGNFDYKTKVAIQGWEGTIDAIRYNSNSQIEVDVTAGATQTNYSILLSNGSKDSTQYEVDNCANAVTVQTITFVDLRTGGDTLTTLTTRTNYALGTQTEANAGVTRDANGMYNSGGFGLWSHWIRFDDFGWTRGSGTSYEIILQNNNQAFMAGIGSDATNPTSTTQYYQAEVETYFQNGTTVYGLFGNNGTPGGAWNQNSAIATTNNTCIKIKFENDGANGETITAYELPTCNMTDWKDTSNVLGTIVSTNPANEVNLFPFAILPNNVNTHIVALRTY